MRWLLVCSLAACACSGRSADWTPIDPPVPAIVVDDGQGWDRVDQWLEARRQLAVAGASLQLVVGPCGSDPCATTADLPRSIPYAHLDGDATLPALFSASPAGVVASRDAQVVDLAHALGHAVGLYSGPEHRGQGCAGGGPRVHEQHRSGGVVLAYWEACR